MNRSISLAALALLALAACGDGGTGPEHGATVRLAFGTSASANSSVAPVSFSLHGGANQLAISGSNGTLTLTDVRLVVAEFELEGPEACVEVDDDGGTELEECEFEAAPFLLELPLGGGEVVVATTAVPAGTYTELEFEAEDLDEDGDDGLFTRQAIADIRNTLSADFPGMPSSASMVAVGTFAPADGGETRSFTVYFDADVEVELDLLPALVIDQAGQASRTITVMLDPTLWFTEAGRVLDLSEFDGQMLEFEAEFENGFLEVELHD